MKTKIESMDLVPFQMPPIHKILVSRHYIEDEIKNKKSLKQDKIITYSWHNTILYKNGDPNRRRCGLQESCSMSRFNRNNTGAIEIRVRSGF